MKHSSLGDLKFLIITASLNLAILLLLFLDLTSSMKSTFHFSKTSIEILA
jgi:hypothetical protein